VGANDTTSRAVERLRALARVATPLAWTVLALGFIAWIVAARFDWEEWFIIAAIAFALFAIGIVYTLGRLSLDASISVSPSRVVVGERAAGELVVSNKRARSALGLRLELPVGKALATFQVTRLKGGASTDELFVVPTHRRAVIPCGPLTSVQGDPLGLMRRTETWTEVEEIYVHPRTVGLSTLAAGQIRDLEGQTTNALSSSDIAFHTLREYVHGDDLRHVHWKSSAKIGELMVRQYNDTRRSHVAVLLSIDPDEYVDDDEYELGISCAASVAVQALRDDQTLTVIAGGRQFPIASPVRLLDHFSAIEPEPGVGKLTDAVTAVRRLAPEASIGVVCVGSAMAIPDVRRALAQGSLEMNTVVLRAEHGAQSGYRRIGDSTFVAVPDLDSLRPSMVAVTT
jgi:uncharacterized protein (DUF58 family)